MRPTDILLVAFCISQRVVSEYTTNAVCLRQYCINPIFPAMEELGSLSNSPWYCSNLRSIRPHLGFCGAAINYDPALPLPEGAGQMGMKDIVMRQDAEASKMFMYHLSGMGIEAWDYQNPAESDDDCVKSIWRMVCFTYFPRAPIGCQEGMQTPYIRPCRSSCQNYIRTCGVECCDESVQCVFKHEKEISESESITTFGYLPHDGPSTLCTGASIRAASPGILLTTLLPLLLNLPFAESPRFLQALALASLPFILQGCAYDIPSHDIGNWRTENDYLIKYQFIPPGAPARDGVLNSCDMENLAMSLQCNGRGSCEAWDSQAVRSPASFCKCDRDWADPECNTRRQSQAGAFLLSMFFGYLGVDHFYMGFKISGTFKLLTLGGGGLWWVYDFIRIGSAPVSAKNFRLAADLPHWVFVLTVVFFGMLLGFSAAYYLAKHQVLVQRKDAMLHVEQEEGYFPDKPKKHPQRRPDNPQLMIGEPGMKMHWRGQKSAYPDYGSVQQETAKPLPTTTVAEVLKQQSIMEPIVQAPARTLPVGSNSLRPLTPVPTPPQSEPLGTSYVMNLPPTSMPTQYPAPAPITGSSIAVVNAGLPEVGPLEPTVSVGYHQIGTAYPTEPIASMPDITYPTEPIASMPNVTYPTEPIASMPNVLIPPQEPVSQRVEFTPSSISGLGTLPPTASPAH